MNRIPKRQYNRGAESSGYSNKVEQMSAILESRTETAKRLITVADDRVISEEQSDRSLVTLSGGVLHHDFYNKPWDTAGANLNSKATGGACQSQVRVNL